MLNCKVWDKKDKQMLYREEVLGKHKVLTARILGEELLAHIKLDKSRYEILYETGLSDKHGFPIYDGDIIKKSFKDQVILRIINGRWRHEFEEFVKKDWEIVGNIFKNPELINTLKAY